MTHRKPPRLAVALLGLGLATAPGCAHQQLTNRQVAIGIIAVAVVGAIVVLAVSQCRKGAAYCDNSPNP